VGQLLSAPLEPVRSAFSLSCSTFLNVTAAYGDGAAESMLAQSFLQHQLEAERIHAEAQLEQLRNPEPDQAGQRISRKQLEMARRRAESLEAQLAAGRPGKELAVLRRALGDLGYLTACPKVALVRGIFDSSALLLAELIADPRFAAESVAAPEFAELIGWFAGAGRPKPSRGQTARLSAALRYIRHLLDDAAARIQRAERNGGMVLTRSVVPAFPNLIGRWCTGDDIGLLCRDYQLSEGDVALHVERTRQLLRQMSKAAAALPAYVALAALAREAMHGLSARTILLEEDSTV